MSLNEHISRENWRDLLTETRTGHVQDNADELRAMVRRAIVDGRYGEAAQYTKALAVRRDQEMSSSEKTFQKQTDAMLVCLQKQKLSKDPDKDVSKKLEIAIRSNKFTVILAAIEVLQQRARKK